MHIYIESSSEEVLANAYTSLEGLTSSEASRRLAEYGPNEIPHRTTHISFIRFFAYMKDGFSLLLLIASALSFISGAPVVGVVILGIVIVNAYASVLQEVRAEKAMQALKGWVPESTKVFRDGRLQK